MIKIPSFPTPFTVSFCSSSRRRIPHPLLRDADLPGAAALLPGAGGGSAHPEGGAGGVAPGVTLPRGRGRGFGRRVLRRGALLQHCHRLVSLLSLPGRSAVL